MKRLTVIIHRQTLRPHEGSLAKTPRKTLLFRTIRKNGKTCLKPCLKTLFPLLIACFSLITTGARAETHFIDLTKAANRGFEESFDEAYQGIEDEKQKQGLSGLLVGIRSFRGVPFRIIDPAGNNGRSFIALKGRRKPDFPEALYLYAGGVQASWLYFLHTCRWGGTGPDVTVAEYNVIYEDGQVRVIPLRVGVELVSRRAKLLRAGGLVAALLAALA